jgi:chorismate mutase
VLTRASSYLGEERRSFVDLDAQSEIERLENQLDRLDIELLRLLRRRTALADRLGDARVQAGEPRIVQERELALARRFAQLRPCGPELAAVLLRLERAALWEGCRAAR